MSKENEGIQAFMDDVKAEDIETSGRLLKVGAKVVVRDGGKEVYVARQKDDVLELCVANHFGATSSVNTFRVHQNTAIMLQRVLSRALELMNEEDEQNEH